MKIKNARKDLLLKGNERLFLKKKSPFTPNKFIDLNPQGLKIFTFSCGFKKKGEDLLVIVFDKTVNVACKYSLTSMPSAPILWDKKNNSGICKALIVNAGNANAFTGLQGVNDISKYVKILTNVIDCSKKNVLVSSTGVIGERLDPDLIEDSYMIQMDNRLGSLTSKEGERIGADFVDDDNVATYIFTQNGSTNGATMVGDIGTGDVPTPLQGARGTFFNFKLLASTNLQTSNFLFTQLGTTKTNLAGIYRLNWP